MEMTDKEIFMSYKLSKDKQQQVKILSELNLCSESDILHIINREMNLESARINKNDSEKQNLHDKVEEIKLKKISDSVHEKEMKKMNVLKNKRINWNIYKDEILKLLNNGASIKDIWRELELEGKCSYAAITQQVCKLRKKYGITTGSEDKLDITTSSSDKNEPVNDTIPVSTVSKCDTNIELKDSDSKEFIDGLKELVGSYIVSSNITPTDVNVSILGNSKMMEKVIPEDYTYKSPSKIGSIELNYTVTALKLGIVTFNFIECKEYDKDEICITLNIK